MYFSVPLRPVQLIRISWFLCVDTRDLEGSLLCQRACEFGASGGRGGGPLPLFSIHGNVVPPGWHPFWRHWVIKVERIQKNNPKRLKRISMEDEADKAESTTGHKERGKWEVYWGCKITRVYWLKRQFLCNLKGCDASYPPANTCKDHQYEWVAPTLAEQGLTGVSWDFLPLPTLASCPPICRSSFSLSFSLSLTLSLSLSRHRSLVGVRLILPNCQTAYWLRNKFQRRRWRRRSANQYGLNDLILIRQEAGLRILRV